MDIYYPPNMKEGAKLPVVIYVSGYPDTAMEKLAGVKLKDFEQYINWGTWTAEKGMIAITYETQQPNIDLEALIEFIRENSTSLNIDPNRIGIWSCSANVLTAQSFIMNTDNDYLKFAVFLYGPMFILDHKFHDQIAAMAEDRGFFYTELKKVEAFRQKIPLLIVRAGKDKIEPINHTIDHFVAQALINNTPLTLINYPEGPHAFDINNNIEEVQEIIQQILEFMKRNLENTSM